MVSSSGKSELGEQEAVPIPDVARERRISEIVLAAAACEPEEREAFLRQVTVEDPELLEEARRRLRQAAELPSAFLAVPAAEILEAADHAAEPDDTTLLRSPTSGTKSHSPTSGTMSHSPTSGTMSHLPASGTMSHLPASDGTVPPPAGPPLSVAGADRYELGECLGRGGMSRVYRAFDRQLERPVALKLLERADPKTLRRFQREAQVQAQVRHEYVLDVYETGDLGGQPFIAMHYVDGPTLMGIRDDTSLKQKVRLMAQVAEGLHAAHKVDLIHRDVKPSNILVEKTVDGRLKPWVADFGIATTLGGGSSIWSVSLAGTPYYIAPERLHEDDRPVDKRSDIYSLGVTIYQLLTGELPFHHPSLAEMLRQVREDEPPSLRDLSPSLPASLDAVVRKCLAKEPTARYPSARAVAKDLWRFIDGEPVEAHTTTYFDRLRRSAAHGRSLPTGALIFGVLLITLLTAFGVWTLAHSRRVADEAEQARLVVDQAEDVLSGLAATFHDQGRYAEAKPIVLRILEIRRKKRLGPEHPQIRELVDRLALYESLDQDKAVKGQTLKGAS